MENNYDIIIIGGGIIGLTTAYQILSLNPHYKLAIIEKEKEVATHQSGHNSGVIHSGVYYPVGSLKAKNCVEGRKELLEFCREHYIPYKMIGKVIVATHTSQLSALEEIYRRGVANGVPNLSLVGKEELAELEPNVKGIRALWVKECGVIHYPDVAKRLSHMLQEMGATIILGEEVKEIQKKKKFHLTTSTKELESRYLVSCAGVYSDRIAKMLQINLSFRMIPFRGEYYELKKGKKDMVHGLVYPVPDLSLPFLGVHFTPMMDGKIEIGPNAVLAFSKEGYKKNIFSLSDCWHTFSYRGFWKMALRDWKRGLQEQWKSLSKKAFVKEAQKMVPSLQAEDVQPGMTGVRAQLLDRKGELITDFAYERKEGALILLNAPSPAATASFAIGRMLAKKVLEMCGDQLAVRDCESSISS